MARTIARTGFLGLLVAAIALAALAAGCSRDSNRPKSIQRSGRVSAINKETGEVKMWYFHPKQKQEVEITGKLTPTVEILINGAVAKVEDVKIDDRVTVTGRTPTRDNPQFVVTRVEVDRPVTETLPAAAITASSPAAAPK